MIRRHPLRGLFGGLLLGIGIALVLMQLSVAPLGAVTVLVVVALCTVLGLIASWALPRAPCAERRLAPKRRAGPLWTGSPCQGSGRFAP